MQQLRYIPIIIVLSATAFNSRAQEFGIEVNAGMQGLQYKLAAGNSNIRLGGSVGFTYTFPLGEHWGVLTGITAGVYNTKAALSDSVYSTPQIDVATSAFTYNVQTAGYRETQRFWEAGIPVMLQYHTLGKTQWYVNAGAKLLLPFSASVKTAAQQLITSGYYPDFNIEVYDMPQHGFGTISNWHGNAAQELKPAVTFSVAAGISFAASRANPIYAGYANRIYVGIYVDYGLNNVIKAQAVSAAGAAPITYNPTDVNAAQAIGILNTANINAAKLLGIGLQVKLGLGNRHSDRLFRCYTASR